MTMVDVRFDGGPLSPFHETFTAPPPEEIGLTWRDTGEPAGTYRWNGAGRYVWHQSGERPAEPLRQEW